MQRSDGLWLAALLLLWRLSLGAPSSIPNSATDGLDLLLSNVTHVTTTTTE